MQGKKLNKKQLDGFLETLKTSHGNISLACRTVGISRNAVHERKKSDPVFAEKWDDIIEFCIESAEQEVYRRAVEGTDKPIFYKGEFVDTVKEFSDRLLEFYLKAKRPEVYRERMDINQSISGNLDVSIESEIDKLYDDEGDNSESLERDAPAD